MEIESDCLIIVEFLIPEFLHELNLVRRKQIHVSCSVIWIFLYVPQKLNATFLQASLDCEERGCTCFNPNQLDLSCISNTLIQHF